jgi:hypothetical protein
MQRKAGVALIGAAGLVLLDHLVFWLVIFHLQMENMLLYWKVIRIVSPLLWFLCAGLVFVRRPRPLWLVVTVLFVIVAVGNAFFFPLQSNASRYWAFVQAAAIAGLGAAFFLHRKDGHPAVGRVCGIVLFAIALADSTTATIHLFQASLAPNQAFALVKWSRLFMYFSYGLIPLQGVLAALFFWGNVRPLSTRSEVFHTEKTTRLLLICGAIGGLLLAAAVGGLYGIMVYGLQSASFRASRYAVYSQAAFVAVGTLFFALGYLGHKCAVDSASGLFAAILTFVQFALVVLFIVFGTEDGARQLLGLSTAAAGICGGISFLVVGKRAFGPLAWGVALTLFVAALLGLASLFGLKSFGGPAPNSKGAYATARIIVTVGASIGVAAFLAAGVHHLLFVETTRRHPDA